MARFIYLLIILVLCSGCATPYMSEGFMGSFKSTQIQDGMFRVNFRGNAYSHTDRVEDFALLRSAELALENGYKYFVIMGENQETSTVGVTTPVTANTTGNMNMYGGNGYAYGHYRGTTTYSGGNTFFINRPSASMVIQCFKEKPNVSGMIYDAEQVRTNIKKSYGIQ